MPQCLSLSLFGNLLYSVPDSLANFLHPNLSWNPLSASFPALILTITPRQAWRPALSTFFVRPAFWSGVRVVEVGWINREEGFAHDLQGEGGGFPGFNE